MSLSILKKFVEDLTGIIVSFIVSGFLGEKIYARGEKRSDGGYNFKEFKVPEDAKEVEYNFFIKLDVKTKYSKERHSTYPRTVCYRTSI